ncbi:hypothetical protein ACFQ1M_00040 [Sungkyunkwania multivorans]|uniref:Lipoprotein n=1 Tax=Sungkyunkwania multivorans TaxID=1173618 RepID=A0ABW3CS49_9FLAO
MKFRYVFLGIVSFFLFSCGHSKRKSDLIANYEEHSTEIMNVKNYFEQIVPENFNVRIRYESSDEIDLIVYERLNDSTDKELLFRKWNIDIDNYIEEPQSDYDKKYHGKTNSFELTKTKLNWTNETIEELYDKLEIADCIGISNWEPVEIEYGYNGLGVYSYKIFNEKLNGELIEKYNDGCNDIYYKDNIVLSYAGGAIGMQCFEDYKRK